MVNEVAQLLVPAQPLMASVPLADQRSGRGSNDHCETGRSLPCAGNGPRVQPSSLGPALARRSVQPWGSRSRAEGTVSSSAETRHGRRSEQENEQRPGDTHEQHSRQNEGSIRNRIEPALSVVPRSEPNSANLCRPTSAGAVNLTGRLSGHFLGPTVGDVENGRVELTGLA